MIQIAISVKNTSARIALLNGDILTEYAIWNFTEPGDIGDRFTARLTAKTPAMAGSFADLGAITGFLPDSAGAATLTEGAYFAACITRICKAGVAAKKAVPHSSSMTAAPTCVTATNGKANMITVMAPKEAIRLPSME